MLDNYECDNQLSLFDFIADNKPKNYKITKPVRLISIFSGYDSQYMALKRLGVDVESYRTSEWCIPVVNLANAIHNNGYFEKTDYSKEEAIEILLKYGVSQDGKTPLAKENLQRKSVDWLNEVIGKFRATHNIGSVCNVKGVDLGITNTDQYCYILTYSFP